MSEPVIPQQVISNDAMLDLGLAVIDTEIKAIAELRARVGSAFVEACQCLLNCQGRVVVTGMGKSGHIANKIAATLASTGTPAFYVHSGEALHGDMGMIQQDDCVVAISNSGETDELLTVLPLIKRINTPLVTMTGRPESTLAQNATVNLDVSVAKEACPLGLAPTASTTVTLVMGDALAVALLKARGFTESDFALSHPGGRLGKRLLLRVQDLMHTGDAIPTVHLADVLPNVLLEISRKRFGMTIVLDEHGQLAGIFTDGDLRRTLDQQYDINTTIVKAVMTPRAKAIAETALASEALTVMETHKITVLVVLDDQHKPTGIIHLHDLIQAKIA